MAATGNRPVYEGSGQLACTLTSLATGSTRESATKANPSTTGDFDVLVSLTFTIATGTPSAGASVNIYAGGSVDGSTRWPTIQLSNGTTKATGAGDASIGALGSPPNLVLIGSFGIQTTSSASERTFRTETFSLAAAFGGTLPPAFSIFVENQSGVAFSSSTTTTRST